MKPKPNKGQMNLAFPGSARVSRQERLILQRLRDGPATNIELAEVSRSMNLTARISNVRKFLNEEGKTVTCRHVDRGRGITEYQIERTSNGKEESKPEKTNDNKNRS